MFFVVNANNKIHSVRESEAHPVNSEVVIRLAHQISKNYSVSAPLYWQQARHVVILCHHLFLAGDPSRPFPTEPEFRASALAAPRTNPPVVPPTFSLLRQQHVAPGGMGRVSSPMAGMPQIPMQGKRITTNHFKFVARVGPPLPMPENKKFIGLSLHPVYGGHFAFRSVFIFPNLRFSSFRAPEPLSILHSTEEIRDALERFNYNWKNSGFRDFGGPRKRYSVTQMEFFGLPPAERWSVLKQWCEE
ncbi:hypothetical protein OSTOST_05576 [Ostertagia ostertagi]